MNHISKVIYLRLVTDERYLTGGAGVWRLSTHDGGMGKYVILPRVQTKSSCASFQSLKLVSLYGTVKR